MTQNREPFALLGELLTQPSRRKWSDKQNNAAEIRRTASFHECPNCGITWSLDEADDCEDCYEKQAD
jgi:hypothetical protein